MERTRGVGLLTLGSRILGLIRDGVMAMQFGNGAVMDAFTTAFRVPNMARQLFGEGALSTAFLPIFLRDLEQHGKRTAFQTASAVLVMTAAFLLALVLVAEAVLLSILIFVPLSAEARLLVGLLATLIPYLMLVCVLAQACAVMQGLGEFRVPAMFPELMNALWIAAAWLIERLVEREGARIYLVAASIELFGLIQLLLTIPTLKRLGFQFEWNWAASRSRIIEIARTTGPVMFGLAITQINQMCDTLIAWTLTEPAPADQTAQAARWLNHYPLTEGTTAALYLGQRLYQFPLGVFAVALGTVIFPLLATHAARNEEQHFGEDLIRGLRMCLAISVPASVGLMLIAEPLTRLLFERGQFDAEDSRQTASIIAAYASGVWAASLLLIINRAQYALGDRQTPLRVGLFAVVFNLTVNLTLVWTFKGIGLAVGTALTAVFQCLLAGWLLTRRLHGLPWLAQVPLLLKTLAATLVMALVCACVRLYVTDEAALPGPQTVQRGLRLAGPLLAGGLAFLLAAKLTGLREPFELLNRRRG